MTHPRTFIALFLTILLVATAGCTDDEEENEPPIANAGQDQTSTMIDEKAIVQFSAGGSSDPNGDTLSYRWDFDDSNGDNDFDSSDRSPTHIFYWTGTYTVTLRVSDGKLSDIDTMKVIVKKEPGNVEAKITSEDELKDTVGEDEEKTITFDGSESSTLEGTIEDWDWDFDYTNPDEFDVDGTGEEASFSFASGIFRVGLRVTNDTGFKAYDTIEVKMNYNMTYNETIEVDESQEFTFPLNSDRAFFMKIVLLSDNENNDGHDLDIYLDFPNGTEANNTDEEDTSHEEIRYNRNGPYGDNLKELGEWKVTIHNDDANPFASPMDYTLHIDVVYFS